MLRLLYFPRREKDVTFSPPNAYNISKSLNLPFSRVSAKLAEMRESGLISKKLSMTLNMAYVGKSQFLLMGSVAKERAEELLQEMRSDSPKFVSLLYYLNVGPPGMLPSLAMEVTCESWELNQITQHLRSRFPGIVSLRVEGISFPVVSPRDPYESRVIKSLSRRDSIERRIVRVLWEDTDTSVPELARKVDHPYRTVKRLLDAMVRVRAFWLFPQVDSMRLKEGGMFDLMVYVDRNREETLSKLKSLLKDEYLMYREYYSHIIPMFGLFGSRKEYEEVLNRLNSSGIRFVAFDDLKVIDPRNCPLD